MKAKMSFLLLSFSFYRFIILFYYFCEFQEWGVCCVLVEVIFSPNSPIIIFSLSSGRSLIQWELPAAATPQKRKAWHQQDLAFSSPEAVDTSDRTQSHASSNPPSITPQWWSTTFPTLLRHLQIVLLRSANLMINPGRNAQFFIMLTCAIRMHSGRSLRFPRSLMPAFILLV